MNDFDALLRYVHEIILTKLLLIDLVIDLDCFLSDPP